MSDVTIVSVTLLVVDSCLLAVAMGLFAISDGLLEVGEALFTSKLAATGAWGHVASWPSAGPHSSLKGPGRPIQYPWA